MPYEEGLHTPPEIVYTVAILIRYRAIKEPQVNALWTFESNLQVCTQHQETCTQPSNPTD